MRVFYVNSENGSVQDVWGDMDYLKIFPKVKWSISAGARCRRWRCVKSMWRMVC